MNLTENEKRMSYQAEISAMTIRTVTSEKCPVLG